MTDFCQIVLLSRPSGTLDGRVFQDPTLRKSEVAPIRSRPLVPCMGLLRFSLFEAVE